MHFFANLAVHLVSLLKTQHLDIYLKKKKKKPLTKRSNHGFQIQPEPELLVPEMKSGKARESVNGFVE